ncbi:hypothetical protein GH714_025453 [Hevea brasiliensis]|uniref:Uncharacterized protein n=1 Tax=Hevea brasiliensis TaxID=3981 RepID=A0A6A6M3Y4_HEVBR|nr:hypothetical protein GH714_025453 [Hevea brasiliensis]
MRTPETKQGEFKNLVSDAAWPFLAARTAQFVNELELFLASGFNTEAYDEAYMQQLGWNTPRLTGIEFEFYSKLYELKKKPLANLDYFDNMVLISEEDVEIIVHHILGVVDSFLRRGDQSHQMRTPETKQGEFKNLVSDAARPFLAARTERFVNELELFLASGLNIEAYDEVYMQQLGWNTPRLTGEGADVEHSEHTPIVPYLYIFDDDSDETD